MVIGMDGNEANVLYPVGVSVYVRNLLVYFQSQSSSDNQFIVYLRQDPRSELPPETDFFKYKIVSGKRLWSTFFLPIHLWLMKLSGKKLDVFFSPAHYIPRYSPFKTVVTIHDLSYLYFPNEFLKKDLYQLKNWTSYALEKSSHVIAVSKTTKKDIVKEYAIPEKCISVIYNGYEKSDKETAVHSPQAKNPYFLYVGTIQPRKNISLLIKSFTLFHANHPSFKLIIVGKKGWLYDTIFQQAAHSSISESILFPGFVEESEKVRLYRGATAYILPSLYEGFGIPLLEAMSHKCPVIASFSSSLPEVGGEACLYFDPQSVEDLREKMELIIFDKALVQDLVIKGTNRLDLFSWKQTGKQTLDILLSMNNEDASL